MPISRFQMDAPGEFSRSSGKMGRLVHQIGVKADIHTEDIMGTLTAELPVAKTNKPLLTVIRPDAPRPMPRLGFVAAFDLLGQAVGVYGLTGALLHRTGAFRAALEQGEIARLVSTAVGTLAAQVRAARLPQVIPSPVFVRCGDRIVRASLYQPSDEPMVLVCLETSVAQPVALTDDQIVQRFGLTPAELRVARHLAAGKPNKDIAAELCLSQHTTRHHTEHVLRKLGIRTRAAVAGKLTADRQDC